METWEKLESAMNKLGAIENLISLTQCPIPFVCDNQPSFRKCLVCQIKGILASK